MCGHVCVGADGIENMSAKKKKVLSGKNMTLHVFRAGGAAAAVGSVPGKHSGNGPSNLDRVQPVGLVYI